MFRFLSFYYPTKLEQRLGYKFKDRQIFEQALSHKSYAVKARGENNEKLEYLGDAVLGLVLGDLLMTKNPTANEGQLSKMRSALVSTKGLYKKSLELGMSRDLKTSASEKLILSSARARLLASALEALIGAIYIEGGYRKVFKVIHHIFYDNLNRDWEDQDYKTILQGKAQKRRNARLHYELVKERGPAHRKTFFVRVFLNEAVLGSGKGPTKKDAEQQAAFYALKKFSRPK